MAHNEKSAKLNIKRAMTPTSEREMRLLTRASKSNLSIVIQTLGVTLLKSVVQISYDQLIEQLVKYQREITNSSTRLLLGHF